MSQSLSKSDSNKVNDARLVDPSGAPFPKRIKWYERLKAIPSKLKIVVFSFVAIIAITATSLTHLETILNYFRSESTSLSVPPITVKISNSAKIEVAIFARGDFLLWLPGSDARHAIGKYEFRGIDGNFLEAGQITIKPGGTVNLLAHVMNQELYARVLEQGDCDISFIIRKVTGRIKFTENLPFTQKAINKYHVSVDLGVE